MRFRAALMVPALVLSMILLMILLAACGEEPRDLKTYFAKPFGDLRLTELVLGQDALDRVDELHGKPIDCEEAAIALFEGPDEARAMVWVSRHDNPAEAREQAAIMLDKMIHPLDGTESPFINPESFRYHGVDVYRFQGPMFGLAMNHDIFARDDLVFWISSTPGVSGLVLDGLLEQ